MLSWLRAIERIAEEAIEGSARKLFRPPMQPVQLAKAAARAMETSESIGPNGAQAANSFTVLLHPTDYQRFAAHQGAFVRQVARHLDRLAAERGYTLLGPVHVKLMADAETSLGHAQATGHYVESPASHAPAGEDLTRTRMLRPAPPRPAPSTRLAWLDLETGARVALGDQALSVGRALDNGLPISDDRVSRYHAVFARQSAGYIVRDLGSTNGTTLDGQPVAREQLLRDGSRVSLGGFRLTFRQADS
jgi:hypothetical protein